MAFACVSLYATSVRYGVAVPSMLVSHRVFQKFSLPLKKPRCTPAARAASTALRCPPDQYSSCPTVMKTFGLAAPVSELPYRSVSTPVWYLTLNPLASSQRVIGYSA